MYKKGVSELLSIVLLVAIVLILSLVVFLFFDINKYLISFEKDLCDNVEIEVKDACYNEKNVIIKLENKGNLDINNGFLFKLNEHEVPSAPLTNLRRFEIKDISIPYEAFVGELDKVIVLSKIKTEEKQFICDAGEYNVIKC